MQFRKLRPEMMNLPEMEIELAYQTKRLYRLRKLERMGKDVEEDLAIVLERETELDLAVRKRYIAMEDIPF